MNNYTRYTMHSPVPFLGVLVILKGYYTKQTNAALLFILCNINIFDLYDIYI